MLFYRGTNFENIFSSSSNFVWISSEKHIAKQYGKNLFKIQVDFNKINLASIEDLENVADTFDFDFDELLYNPTNEFVNALKSKSIDAYFLDSYFENFCLFNPDFIKNVILIKKQK